MWNCINLAYRSVAQHCRRMDWGGHRESEADFNESRTSLCLFPESTFNTGLRGQARRLGLCCHRDKKSHWVDQPCDATYGRSLCHNRAHNWPTCQPVQSKSTEPMCSGSCFPLNSNRVTSIALRRHHSIFNLMQASGQ